MTLIKKPMLSEGPEDDDLSFLTYPLLASPKYDGIRCLTQNSKVVSRKFIDIPNAHIQSLLKGLPDDLDGELMIDGNFNSVQSAVMSEDGNPDIKFFIFDYVKQSLSTPYNARIEELKALKLPSYCIKVLPVQINNEKELLAYMKKCLKEGYEGIMLRKPNGHYKCGRSTLNEGLLIKMKEFKDSEALIIGFEEGLRNWNEATKDAQGHTKRSSHKANMIPAGTLGKFLVVEIGNTKWKGESFAIGTGKGLTHELRQEIWDNREKYLNKIVSYTYQPHGMKNVPRLPIWKGFRDKRDMS